MVEPKFGALKIKKELKIETETAEKPVDLFHYNMITLHNCAENSIIELKCFVY